MRILVTGGAGFVGSHLAIGLKIDQPDADVIALDNLKRRGSELSVPRLRDAGVTFLHGDIRSPEDLENVGARDIVIECSAEPSVHAGYDENPTYLINTNLGGTINCLEYARRSGAGLIFLSSSRVYPIAALRALPLERDRDRFEIHPGKEGLGWSRNGISIDFPLTGARSLYGATKLCSELLIEEYAAMYGVRTIINRCGVLTGPWQMGKVDQGFVVLWAARHLFGGNLAYLGFDGEGLQVRDILHVNDLHQLVKMQLKHLNEHSGQIYTVGGGRPISVSLRELTNACVKRANRELTIDSVTDTRDADVPYYVTDNRAVSAATGWEPQTQIDHILDEIFDWLRDYEQQLRPILGQ